MTSHSENELLTRVGPGTAMGNLMRHYWIPACLSSELKADGDPVRLMLPGEKLIAFRDTAGRIGIMDHRCPHRCASLFFGRNEEGGIRCVYHGWKFDTAGNCLEMPNLPPDQDFRGKMKAKAYTATERNGLVFVYMGERATAPPLPALEAMLCPPEETDLNCKLRECNWLQALEGDIDTSHFSFPRVRARDLQHALRDLENHDDRAVGGRILAPANGVELFHGQRDRARDGSAGLPSATLRRHRRGKGHASNPRFRRLRCFSISRPRPHDWPDTIGISCRGRRSCRRSGAPRDFGNHRREAGSERGGTSCRYAPRTPTAPRPPFGARWMLGPAFRSLASSRENKILSPRFPLSRRGTSGAVNASLSCRGGISAGTFLIPRLLTRGVLFVPANTESLWEWLK